MKLILLFFLRLRLRPAINTSASSVQAEAAAEIAGIAGINESFDPAQEWITLPYGIYPNARGLQVFDRTAADAMVAAFNSLPDRAVRGFRGLPILIGHPDDREWLKDHPGARADAVGRIRELRAEETGLAMRTALNDEGKRLLSGEAAPYDGFSPNWLMAKIRHAGREAFRPLILKSIGLTNNPNIPGTRIGINEAADEKTTTTMKDILLKILAALGRTVAANATDDQVIAAANEAEPTAKAAVLAHTELGTVKTQLTTATNEATAAKAEVVQLRTQLADQKTATVAERTARAKVIVTGAINEGRIVEAKRGEWEGKLVAAANDTAFAAIETEISKLKPAINTTAKSGHLGSRRDTPEAKNRIAAINEAVAKHKKETGETNHVAAFNAVRAKQPELFEAANAE